MILNARENLGTVIADIAEPGDFRAPVTDQRRRPIILRLARIRLCWCGWHGSGCHGPLGVIAFAGHGL
jgi:hypothetical protein